MAPCSIGPRQTTASPGGTKKPIDITFRPADFDGWILPLDDFGLAIEPSRCGMLGP